MKCTSCGSDVPDGKRFCTNCGAPVEVGDQQTEQMGASPVSQAPPTAPQPTTPLPAVQATAAAPAGAVQKHGMPTSARVIIAVLAGLLVIGAIAGVVIWQVAASNRLVAQIQKVELVRSDGKALNPKDVPLDTDVKIEVTCLVKYRQGGRAKLTITLLDGNGEQVRTNDYTLKSSGNPQARSDEYVMSLSEGETFKAKATLKVTRGDKSAIDSATLSYYVKEGKGADLKFEDVKTEATAKLEEATKAVQELVGLGIQYQDLTQTLSDAVNKLSDATTEKEANDALAVANAVLAECATRKANAANQAAAEAQNRDTCKRNQQSIRQRLIAYYDEGGNFPDSMSYLGSLPSCPSGGSYSYSAPDTTPSSLSVYCSVHGSLAWLQRGPLHASFVSSR